MKVLLPTLIAIVLLIPSGAAAQDAAQNSPEDRIKERLSEILEMTDEEQSTIEKLREHLERALAADNQAGANRLQEEIASAELRKGQLKELLDRLELLLSGIAQQADARIPQPLAGANRANPLAGRKILRATPDGNMADRFEGNRNIVRPAAEPESRLERLKRSLEDLRKAGELELARQVEQLIKREERIVEERKRQQREAEARKRREREAQRDSGGDQRPRNPAAAANNPERQRPGDNQTVNELKDEISRMREEMRQLREEIRRLKESAGGKDG